MSADGLSTPRGGRLPGGLIGVGLAVIAVAVVAAAVTLVAPHLKGGSSSSGGFIGATMPPNFHAPNFTLTDQDGRSASLDQYRGRVVLLTFLHSKCKGECPIIAQQIRGALDDLGPAARGVSALAVSVDPPEDTQRSRRHFLSVQHMTGRLRFFGGTRTVLARTWKSYGIGPVGHPGGHSLYVFLIDRRGIARIAYPLSQLTPDDLAHDTRLLLGGATT